MPSTSYFGHWVIATDQHGVEPILYVSRAEAERALTRLRESNLVAYRNVEWFIQCTNIDITESITYG
jgi:hypothetical protein